MKRAYKTIFFTKSFVTGLFFPVLTLFILGRGATLRSLPFIMGSYSFMAILLEFPSGVACDLFGRKKTFFLSEILMLLAYIGLFFSTNVLLLAVVMGMQGCARAFSSGSLDALVIEQTMETEGTEGLARVNGELGLLQSAGIAVGSIMSGILVMAGGTYNFNFCLAIIGHILILLLTVFGVKETMQDSINLNSPKKAQGVKGLWRSFYLQMKESLRAVWTYRAIRLIAGLLFVTGMVLMTIETYWQSNFQAMTVDMGAWIFGVVGCIGFGATALGSVCMQRILERKGRAFWWKGFFLTKLFLGVALLLFGLQMKWYGFVLGYTLLYLVVGSASVVENTLLSEAVPSKIRAGIMSFTSLVLQLGALLSTVICSVIITRLSISLLWIVAGVVFLLVLLVAFLATRNKDLTH
ncbi:MAG: hypothetical protein PWP24_633 [Clostridiales bacterium]|nr:hypothetical protein [Clostridiales bacterium]